MIFHGQVIHGSTRLETNTIGSKLLFYLLKQRPYRLKTILAKFDRLTSGDLNFIPELKNGRSSFGMIFNDLLNAVCSFALRCAGADIDEGGGGVFKHHPQQVVENPEAHHLSGRGLTQAVS